MDMRKCFYKINQINRQFNDLEGIPTKDYVYAYSENTVEKRIQVLELRADRLVELFDKMQERLDYLEASKNQTLLDLNDIVEKEEDTPWT